MNNGQFVRFQPIGSIPAGIRDSAVGPSAEGVRAIVVAPTALANSLPVSAIESTLRNHSWSPNILDSIGSGNYGLSITAILGGLGGLPLFNFGIDLRVWNALYDPYKQNLKDLAKSLVKGRLPEPTRLKPGGPLVSPADTFVERKFGELIDQLTLRGGANVPESGGANKVTWLRSDEGSTWFFHQLPSVLHAADASGKAMEAAADIVVLLDRFGKCTISSSQLVADGGQLMAKYDPNTK